MPAKLESRLPEIIGALPLRVGAAIHAGTEQMAQEAKDRAPVRTGELRDSIEAREGISKDHGHAYGIWAAWYWRFSEFGTVHEPARPWMIPAVESNKDSLVEAVRAALEKI